MPKIESETYLPVGYVLEDLVTKALIETDLEVQLILEKLFEPIEGMKVVYNDAVWTIENVEIPDSLSGKMYQIRRNNASIAVNRDDFRIFNPVHDKDLIEKEELSISIKVGDFVTCPYTTHVCIVIDIKKDGLTKIESIVDKHTYGCSVKDLYLLIEQDIDPEIGTKVIYDNQLWDIFGKLRTNQKDGKWNTFHLQNVDTKELLFEIEREQYTIYNPVFDHPTRYLDLPVDDKVETKFYPVITTGSFVYHKTKDKYGVVMQIDNDNILAIRDLVNEDIGFLYEEESDHLEIVREEDIELRPGMKIIYEGFVGTYKLEDGLAWEYCIKRDQCEIFNPYFHDYEEKNGLKILKLRDFIDTPLKPFNENLYFMGVDPFQNEEPLGCSTSFPVGELKKGIEYRDFVKMAENDIETSAIETNFSKVTFVGEDLFKMSSDNIEPVLQQGLKQSEGKLMVQELYWPFIEQMARVMTINKEKYPPKNYMKPMDKEELLAAAQRHQLSIWLGEEIDPTDGQPHAVKVATNMMMYYCQCKLYPDA